MTWFKNLRDLINPSKEKFLCMVVSEQEGAEIWVNDVFTGELTPRAVYLNKSFENKVTLKLTGHRDHTAILTSTHTLSYYHCSLERIPLKLVVNNDALETSV